MARIVITGANRGIGLALANLFAARSDDVVVACRKSSPELSALKAEVHEGVEITDDESVERFAAAIGAAPVDILVNNDRRYADAAAAAAKRLLAEPRAPASSRGVRPTAAR